jgi:hypothetical protein
VARAAVVVAVFAAAGLVGAVLSRIGDDRPASAPTPETGQWSQPNVVVAGRVADSAVDVEEATRAALVAVGSTGEVVRAGMFTRADVIGGLATEAYAPVLASETTQQVNAFLLGLGEAGVDPSQLRVLEAPVTWRATAEPDGSVMVEVWSVLAVSVRGTSTARQAWRTVTVTMRLVEGRWLVDGWASRSGPTPALPPEAAIDDRSDVDLPLSWSPAVAGGGR